MPKIYLGKNVYEAAKERIEFTFDNFEKVYCSFSGGKDSTVMLHMVMDEAIKRDKKIGVLFVDLEGQYKLTIDHIHKCYDMYKDHIERHWVCLPIHLRNAVSVYDPFWKCWDTEREKDWIREKPKDCIGDNDFFDWFWDGMEFEEFVPLFGEWYAEGKTTACLVGIRADESLNRFRTLANTYKTIFKGQQWTTKVTDNVYNVYPIYDFKTEDIWAYHGKNPGKPYNQLYDYMYKAGLTINQQRICQPYGDDQRRGLWLFHLIEPETWGKVVRRVNGANSGAKYIQENGNITGYHKISKPDGHTWESFARLLLASMPERTRIHFQNKFLVWFKWWAERGYPNGIPDEADYKLEVARKVPSWRRICKTLLRNDYWCKLMGFSQTKSDAYHKYLKMMKKRREQEKWQLNIFNHED